MLINNPPLGTARYLPDIPDTGNFWLTSLLPATIVNSFWYAYHAVVTRPLEYFYFVGPVWKNLPPQEICNAMTDNRLGSDFWIKNMPECLELLHRNFVSWDTTIITSLYFLVVSFATVYVTCHCCFIPKLCRYAKKKISKERKRRKKMAELNNGIQKRM